jgi:uncharacterized DUF497 family protein
MEFEFDPEKSRTNASKHGISFEQAKGLWDDELRLVVPARSEDEARFAIIANWQDRLWTGIFTLRGQSVRLISVRRARESEEQLYESTGL